MATALIVKTGASAESGASAKVVESIFVFVFVCFVYLFVLLKRNIGFLDSNSGEQPSIKRGLFRRVFSKSSSSNLSPAAKDGSGSSKDVSDTSKFMGTWNVKFDKKGNLFLSDPKDNHVRMIKATGCLRR